MAPKTYGDDDDEPEAPYHESSDEDFNPDSAPADSAASSSDDDATPAPRRGKRGLPVSSLDSGDEVTIDAARKKTAKKRKHTPKHDVDLLSSSSADDADAGLIKTRAQRAVGKPERRPLARTAGATVDVDALWAQMTAAPLQPAPALAPDGPAHADSAPGAAGGVDEVPERLVTITKTYTFAGQRTTDTKQIPPSALAQHNADGWISTHPHPHPHPHPHRPLRRASRFDPNPTGLVRALPPEHQLHWPRKVSTLTTTTNTSNTTNTTLPLTSTSTTTLPTAHPTAKPPTLNVVAKSRLDWTGFVHQAGLAEELVEHGKSKENYMSRRAFLEGVEARREEEGRRGRVAGAGVPGV
ncbi:hypothetical protein EJ07DRAFT_162174 [Lizonia empirigonia]|nr:hypothetical protein EJ07DRAFT_162174 [Lizonia empirigonia]